MQTMPFYPQQKEFYKMKVTIIDYGAGNVFSVLKALERQGITPILTADENEIRSSDKVIFPGVGHAESAMNKLKENKLDLLIPSLKQNVLGICLGMQLMCDFSEEGDTKALGIFTNVQVLKFKDVAKIPHMGWNTIETENSSLFPSNEDFYFVHSYYVPENPYTTALCNYGQAFSATMEKDNFFACQFHPEKSGSAGEVLFQQFLNL